MLSLYCFGRVHEKVIGVTRDLRALWMLEECGLPYTLRGLDHSGGELNSEAFRRLNPFVQLPVLEDDGFVLTETGAILLYLAEKSGRLMFSDLQGRAQVTRWCFAALNSVEPPLFQIAMIDLFNSGDPAEQARRAGLLKWAERVLGAVEEWLSARPYLCGEDFTVADILMTTVLREVRGSEVLAGFPRVRAYQQKCEARPAWQHTLQAYEQRLGAKPGSTR